MRLVIGDANTLAAGPSTTHGHGGGLMGSMQPRQGWILGLGNIQRLSFEEYTNLGIRAADHMITCNPADHLPFPHNALPIFLLPLLL